MNLDSSIASVVITGHTSLWTKDNVSRGLAMAMAMGAMTLAVVYVFAYHISCIWPDQNVFASFSLYYHFTSLRLLPLVYVFEQLACKTILLTLVTHTQYLSFQYINGLWTKQLWSLLNFKYFQI